MIVRDLQRSLSRTAALILAVWLTSMPILAQESEAPKEDPGAKRVELPMRELPADSRLTKAAQATIRGASVPYRVTTGTQPVYGEDGAGHIF